jgi:hypothetical protein
MQITNPLRALILNRTSLLRNHPFLFSIINFKTFDSFNFLPIPIDTPPSIGFRRSVSHSIIQFTTLTFSKTTLSRYILPCARISKSRFTRRTLGCDAVLKIPDALLRARLIRWRCWTFGIRRKCVCGRRFTQDHFGRCIRLPPDHPALDLLPLLSQHNMKHNLASTKYALMECALNARRFDLAELMIDFISNNLSNL